MAFALAFAAWFSRTGCGMKMIPMEHGSAIGGFLHVCILALELKG